MSDATNGGRPDRRGQGRLDPHGYGIVSVRLRPGLDVILLNVSAAGALIESEQQLRPGCAVEVQMVTHEQRIAVRGRVLRCAVSRLLTSGVWYRGAIAFNHQHPWFPAHVEREGPLILAKAGSHSAGRAGSAPSTS